MENARGGSSPFRRLGGFVYRRKKYIIILWILALVVASPAITAAGSVTSLQEGTATGSQLESVQASNLISSQFAKSVPNSTLLVVVSGSNVSSPATQEFVQALLSKVKSDQNIEGLVQTEDVYSKLYTALEGVDQYVGATYEDANETGQLLYGVPALYVGYWEQYYSSNQNASLSNLMAYASSNRSIAVGCRGNCSGEDPSLQLLSLFNTSWSQTWSNSSTEGLNATARAGLASSAAGLEFIQNYSTPSSRPLELAVLRYFTIGEFLGPGAAPSASQLGAFSVEYAAQALSYSDTFVASAYSLGKVYTNSSLYALAGNIVWRPERYQLDPSLTDLVSSLVSPGRNITLISLGFNQSLNQDVLQVRADVKAALSSQPAGSGIGSVLVTGQDAITYDFGQSTESDLGLILPVTIALLIVATGLFFRSALTPFVTLGTIGVALGISQSFVLIVGTYVAKVDFTVPTVLLTVLIGVGTDYSVFVIARYREERVKGLPVQDAVETAVTWAGESIATSGATVIISFLALALTSIVFLRTMGMVVGLGVLLALAVALTLVPSVVGILGGRTFWPTSGERFLRYAASATAKLHRRSGYFSKSGSFAVRRAKYLIILALLATGPALYVYSTTTPTYDILSAAPSSLQSIAASNQLTSAFGAGTLYPTYVVVTFSSPLVASTSFNSSEMQTLESMSQYLASNPDVSNVTGPTRPFGAAVAYSDLNLTSAAGKREFSKILGSIGTNNATALITVDFKINPYDTPAIADAQAFRDHLHSSYSSAPGVTGIYLGGASGSILDTKNVFNSEFSFVVPAVAVGVALVLLFVLGSAFLPVFAVLSVLMSIVWTLAVTKILFQSAYNYQILFITPFFLFVVLLGLGMDYNVFILTRIREEATKGKRLNEAIVGAIEQTGGIITAAAIILAGSLGSLMLSSDLLLKELGFSLAFSILIDALVVRTYMVPAVMSVMGRWNWYSPIPYLRRSRKLFEGTAAENA